MKTFLLSLLLSLSFSASAQTYGVGAGFDYDSATDNSIGLDAVTKTSLLAGVRGKYGQLDGGVYHVEVLGAPRVRDRLQGAEIGYGYTVPIGKVQLGGRVAAGKVFNRAGRDPNGSYSTYSVTATYPLTERISPFLAYRFRPGQYLDRQHLYTAGVNLALSKKVILQGTYRQTRSTGPVLNGLTAQVVYFF